MSGFDRLAAGTPEASWRLEELDPLPLPFAGDRIVVLAAHPDDETLGAGGLIAACARRRAEVVVVVASDGEASHPHSPTIDAARLATIRRVEVQSAIEVLAPGTRVQFLGLPDGELAAHHAALLAQVAHFARGASHLVSPWRQDRHPDHEACAAAAAEVARHGGLRHWQFPIWAWHWADPTRDELPLTSMRRVELGGADYAAKQRALACHRSQHTSLSDAPGDEAILPPAILEHFTRPFECFVVDEKLDASSPAFFEALYASADDPWGLQERFYENRKRGLELAVLPRPHFRRAFEPGCATGLLTEQLARRCDEVVAWDVSESAIAQTKVRLGAAPGVTVGRGQIPDDWPAGEFDLVVLSEVGYYCVDLDQLVARVLDGLAADGVVLACHWRHPAPEHPQTAQAVHRALGGQLPVLATHTEDDFLLQVWSRTGRSVAAVDGIVP